MIVKIIVYLILTVSGLMLIKLGGSSDSINIAFNKININISYLSLMGMIFYVMSFLTWISIVKDNEISFIFPIANGLVTVMTVIGGIVILNEKVSLIQWTGIICIIVGVFIINFSK